MEDRGDDCQGYKRQAEDFHLPDGGQRRHKANEGEKGLKHSRPRSDRVAKLADRAHRRLGEKDPEEHLMNAVRDRFRPTEV